MKTQTRFGVLNPNNKYLIRDKKTKKTIFRNRKKLQFRSKFAAQQYLKGMDNFKQELLEVFDNRPDFYSKGKRRK